jgi:serine/threonine-protein kinase
MAPEQGLDALTIDERADVFGLGALLHEILFARPPREARDLTDLLRDITVDEAAAGLMFPRGLLQLCARSLQRERALRPQSAAQFRDELEATLEEQASVDVRVVAAGGLIIAEGEAAREAFIIMRGTCQVWHLVDGERRVLRSMGPGETFGETAVFDGGARTASVSALDHVELVVVPGEEILGRLGARTFVTTLAKRFRELSRG